MNENCEGCDEEWTLHKLSTCPECDRNLCPRCFRADDYDECYECWQEKKETT